LVFLFASDCNLVQVNAELLLCSVVFIVGRKETHETTMIVNFMGFLLYYVVSKLEKCIHLKQPNCRIFSISKTTKEQS